MGHKNFGRLGDRPAERRKLWALAVSMGTGVIAFVFVFITIPHFDGGHILFIVFVGMVAWLITRLMPL